ncbi:hypothetical protein PBI_MOSMORIS_26 [Mycobacterium phage MosMoris]|uniref:Uncharacterized protein n=2 Tax=Marvinvirus mosmoris TaxID=1982093 RepID=A0A023ZY43_9CAUD|nr:hypothetical protein FH33_gp026 [Mycobacterium phage MosMoris]AHY84100.1 hypothetical protein PBI_MOSMORIS_26 [Mycobacterium phage MosMoris]ANM46250.1 hypothetical protein SEA_GATTACA_27 [Mycobacterium phage Gattaca]
MPNDDVTLTDEQMRMADTLLVVGDAAVAVVETLLPGLPTDEVVTMLSNDLLAGLEAEDGGPTFRDILALALVKLRGYSNSVDELTTQIAERDAMIGRLQAQLLGAKA